MASIQRRVVIAMAAVLAVSAPVAAQTRIDPDKNGFSPAQDVELGRRAAAELRREIRISRDRETQAEVERIGRRLVAAIPGRLWQPQFRYTFEVVDDREINA